jgi:surface protein/VCBS repeat-containing protein
VAVRSGTRLAAVALAGLALAACGGSGGSPLGEASVSNVTPPAVSREGAHITITGANLFQPVTSVGFPAELSATLCGAQLEDLQVQGELKTISLPPAGRVTVREGDTVTGTLEGHQQSGPGDLTLRLPDGRVVTKEGVVTCYDPAPAVAGFALDTESVRAGKPVTFTWQAQSPEGLDLTCSLDPGDGGDPVTPGDCRNGHVAHTYLSEGDVSAALTVRDSEGRESKTELAFHVGYVPPQASPDTASVNIADLPLVISVADLLANDVGEGLTVTAVGPAGRVTLSGDTVTYDPGTAYDHLGSADSATDTFTYTVRDAVGTTVDGEVTVTITGQDRVLGLSLSVPDGLGDLFPGMSFDLDADVDVAGTLSKAVTWESSDEDVAVVDADGRVETREDGTVTITARSVADPSSAASLQLTVDPALSLQIDLRLSGVTGTTFQLPIYADGQFTVHWGDGTSETVDDPAGPKHAYADADAYVVNVTGAPTGAARLGTGDWLAPYENAAAIEALVSWGDMPLTSLSFAFHGAANLTSVPDHIRATVTDLSGMFYGATRFNQDISGWDTGQVTDMSFMFHTASAFDQPIGTWDTGQVTSMRYMFVQSLAFNQDLRGWVTSNVRDMTGMFLSAASFDGDITKWDTSQVENMSSMFSGAWAFNQDISAWETGNVKDMSYMFYRAAAFNQNIGAWNTSQVEHMHHMFTEAAAFDQNIGAWNTSNVDDMNSMFEGAFIFNQDISGWNT